MEHITYQVTFLIFINRSDGYLLEARAPVPPYVTRVWFRKQNGTATHGSISVQTPIFHLVVNSTCLKTLNDLDCLALPQNSRHNT